MNITIIDNKFNKLGVVDEYESFMFTKKYHGIGSFEFHLHSTNNNAEYLQKENIIFTTEDKAFIILYRQANTVDDTLVVKGLELKSYFSRWLTEPPRGQSHFKMTDRTGFIMTLLTGEALDRLGLPMFSVNLAGLGKEITYQSRYKNLAEELEKMSIYGGVGWDVRLDIKNKEFIIHLYEGVNRTSSQTENAPAIFSVEYDNVSNQELIESRMDYANVAIVAGQGEGVEREIVRVGTNLGLQTYETFVDARDIKISSELPARGQEKLMGMQEIITFDSEVIADSNLVYEVDYNLGDLVTNESKDWDITIDRRITGITEIYEKDGFRLKIEFGQGLPGVMDMLKKWTDDLVE